MPDYNIKLSISERDIERAVKKAGNVSIKTLQTLANRKVAELVEAKLNLAIGDIDELLEKAIDEVDWNSVVKEYVQNRLRDYGRY